MLARYVHVGRALGRHPDVDEWKEARARILRELSELKTAIARELENAERGRELTVRSGSRTCCGEFAIKGTDEVGVVTTNWDLALETAGHAVHAKIPFFYVHGNRRNPTTMYLPTEIVEEPYRTDEELSFLTGGRGGCLAAC